MRVVSITTAASLLVLLAALAGGCGSGDTKDPPSSPVAQATPAVTETTVAPAAPTAPVPPASPDRTETAPATTDTVAALEPPPKARQVTVSGRRPEETSSTPSAAPSKRAVSHRRMPPAPKPVRPTAEQASALHAAYDTVADGIQERDWQAVCSGLDPNMRNQVAQATPQEDACPAAAERVAGALVGAQMKIHHLRVAGGRARAENERGAPVAFTNIEGRWFLTSRP